MVTPRHERLDPATIIVRDRLRRALPDRVEALRSDIREKGFLQPIEVVETDGGPRLIYGAHRLAVAVAESMTIPALVYPTGTFGAEEEIRAREISENFFRFELTVLERAVTIAEWREVHEALHGAAKRGRKPKAPTDADLDEMSAKFALNFADTVQRVLGLSRRAVYLALKVATISVDVRDLIADHRVADHQSDLLALAGEPVARQRRIADCLVAGAYSVADAIALIDDTPEPVRAAGWERLSERFGRLRPPEQHAFFALHEDLIRAWIAERS